MDIEEIIKDFFKEIERDKNHRYKSWEHCYKYFSLEDKKIDKDVACLHLAFYLASWGMYRGSAFLLQKDYLIHMPAVEVIIKRKDDFQNIDFSKSGDKKLLKIIALVKEIKKQYIDNIKIVNGEKRKIDVSDALVSKILLGTFACIPAYDRYFREGLKRYFKNEYKGILTLNKKSLFKISNFYKTYKNYFDRAQREIKEKAGVKYPVMKLVDMYFWNKGFKKGFIQIPLLVIISILAITVLLGTGAVLNKTGKLKPLVANMSSLFEKNESQTENVLNITEEISPSPQVSDDQSQKRIEELENKVKELENKQQVIPQPSSIPTKTQEPISSPPPQKENLEVKIEQCKAQAQYQADQLKKPFNLMSIKAQETLATLEQNLNNYRLKYAFVCINDPYGPECTVYNSEVVRLERNIDEGRKSVDAYLQTANNMAQQDYSKFYLECLNK